MAPCTRRQFQLLVAGVATHVGLGCGRGTPTVSPLDRRIELPFARFSALAQPGGGVVVAVSGSFPVAVVRTDEHAAVALSATCTHVGCLLDYDKSPPHLHCACHGANFALDGAVLNGPTTVPLPTYAATVRPDAIAVDLS